jgi:hypothetical protein
LAICARLATPSRRFSNSEMRCARSPAISPQTFLSQPRCASFVSTLGP